MLRQINYDFPFGGLPFLVRCIYCTSPIGMGALGHYHILSVTWKQVCAKCCPETNHVSGKRTSVQASYGSQKWQWLFPDIDEFVPDELGEGWFFVGIDFFWGRSTFEASGGGPGGMTGMIYFHFWQLMHFDRLLMHANWDGKRIVICGIFTSTAAGVCLDGIVAC